MPEFFSVAIYETNRAFGGKEEGGWYYDTGFPTNRHDLAVLTRMFPKAQEEEARKYRESLEEVASEANKEENRKDPSSVLCNGYYEVLLMEGYPQSYPDQKPHYE